MSYYNRNRQASPLLTIIAGSIFVLIGVIILATELMNCSGWETVNVTYTLSDCKSHKNSKAKRLDTECSYVAEYYYRNKKYTKTLYTHDRRPSIFYIDTADPNKYLPYPPKGDYTLAIICIIAGIIPISIGIIQKHLKTEERQWEQKVEQYAQNHANELPMNKIKESQEYNISDLREYDNQK